MKFFCDSRRTGLFDHEIYHENWKGKIVRLPFEWMSLLGRCQNNFKTGLKFPFSPRSCPNICMSSQKKPIFPDRLGRFSPFSNAIHWSALLQSKLHLWRMRRRGCMAWGGGLCAFKERGGSGQINTSHGTALSSVFLTEENIEICKLSEFWQQVVNLSIVWSLLMSLAFQIAL